MIPEKDLNMISVNCPACGEGTLARSSRLGKAEKAVSRALLAKCTNCGAEYGSDTKEFYILFSALFESAGTGTIVKNGLKGELRGVEYEIKGYTVFVREDEPGRPFFTEWHAESPEGDRVVFAEESGFVFLYRRMEPSLMEYDSEGGLLLFEGKRIALKKKGPGAFLRGQSPVCDPEGIRVAFESGITSDRRVPGEKTGPVSLKKDGRRIRVWISERGLSAARGERIPFAEFMLAFRESEFRDQYGRTMFRRSLYFRKAFVYAAGAFTALGFMVYGFFSGGEVEGVMNLKTPIIENRAADGETGFSVSRTLYGPFRTGHRDNTLFRFELSLDKTAISADQSPPVFRVFLIDEKRLRRQVDNPENISELKRLFDEIDAFDDPLESYMITVDFNHKRFYEGTQRRDARDARRMDMFLLENAGRYYILLEKFYGQRPLTWGQSPGSDLADERGTVPLYGEENEFYSFTLIESSGQRYFGAAFFMLTLFFLVNWKKSRSYSELPFPAKGGIL